jgi:hypothetical protein
VLRQWIQEIFDFRFLICDLVPSQTFIGSFNRQSAIKNQKSTLSLRKLEALPSTLLSVLLALLDAWVTGHKTCVLQRGTKVCIVFKQSTGYSVSNSAGLTGWSTTLYIDEQVKLIRRLRQL